MLRQLLQVCVARHDRDQSATQEFRARADREVQAVVRFLLATKQLRQLQMETLLRGLLRRRPVRLCHFVFWHLDFF
jgi:hypothetical protein